MIPSLFLFLFQDMVQDVYSVHQRVCNRGRLGIQP